MKWNEMTATKKSIYVIGLICGISFLILEFLDLCGMLTIPLFSIYLLTQAIIQNNKKYAITYYLLSAGYVLLALLYLFA